VGLSFIGCSTKSDDNSNISDTYEIKKSISTSNFKYLLYQDAEKYLLQESGNIDAAVSTQVDTLGLSKPLNATNLNFLNSYITNGEAYRFVENYTPQHIAGVEEDTTESITKYITGNEKAIHLALQKQVDLKIASIPAISLSNPDESVNSMLASLIMNFDHIEDETDTSNVTECSAEQDIRGCYKGLTSEKLHKLFSDIDRAQYYPENEETPTAVSRAFNVTSASVRNLIYNPFVGTLDEGSKYLSVAPLSETIMNLQNNDGYESLPIFTWSTGVFNTKIAKVDGIDTEVPATTHKDFFAISNKCKGQNGEKWYDCNDPNKSSIFVVNTDENGDFYAGKTSTSYLIHNFVTLDSHISTNKKDSFDTYAGLSAVNIDDDIKSELIVASFNEIAIYDYDESKKDFVSTQRLDISKSAPYTDPSKSTTNEAWTSVSTMYTKNMDGIFIVTYRALDREHATKHSERWQKFTAYRYDFETKTFHDVNVDALNALDGFWFGISDTENDSYDPSSVYQKYSGGSTHHTMIGLGRESVSPKDGTIRRIKIYWSDGLSPVESFLTASDDNSTLTNKDEQPGSDKFSMVNGYATFKNGYRTTHETYDATAVYKSGILTNKVPDITTLLLPPPNLQDASYSYEIEETVTSTEATEHKTGSSTTRTDHQSVEAEMEGEVELEEIPVSLNGGVSVGHSWTQSSGSSESTAKESEFSFSSGSSTTENIQISYNLYNLWEYSYEVVDSTNTDIYAEGKTYYIRPNATSEPHSVSSEDYARLYNIDFNKIFDLSYDADSTKYYAKYSKLPDLIDQIKPWQILLKDTPCQIPDSDGETTASCSIDASMSETFESEVSQGRGYGWEGSVGFGVSIAKVFKIGGKGSWGTDWDEDKSTSISHEFGEATEVVFTYTNTNQLDIFKKNYKPELFIGVWEWTDENGTVATFPAGFTNEAEHEDGSVETTIKNRDVFTILGVGLLPR